MGNFRKAIASISMVAILSTLVVTTTAFAAYSDVPADHWAYTAVSDFEEAGVLTPAETLRVNDPVNRAEIAKMLVTVGGFEGDTLCSASFEDCEAGSWYDTVLGVAFQNNIFRGNDDGEMMPGANILRADIATVLHRAAGASTEYMGSDYFPDVVEGSYYDAAVGWAYCNQVVGGYQDGTFGPARNATRGEAVVMLHRAYSEMEVRAECTATPDPDPEVPVEATGGVTVTASDDTPEGATLPSGATSVPVATWDFTAGEDDAQLQSLEVHMFGVSSLPTDHQVYLYEGSERLTSGRSVNTTTRVATFNSLNWAIENGETRTLTLRLDVGTVSSTGELGFEIESASAVMAGGDVDGDFPVEGEVFGTSTTAAGEITVDKNGTVPNPKVGEDDVTIAKFKMTSSGETAWLEEFGLYITGNISADAIENLELYVSGEDDPVATAEGVNDRDVATFVFEEGYEIPKGDNKAFWVQADLNTGRTDDTIKAYIDEKSDVRAIGDIYGFGMQVNIASTDSPTGSYDGTSCTSSSGSCTYSTVEGGDVTISSNGPVAQDVAIAGDDVSLMDFSLTAVSDITVKNLPIQITASETAAAGGLMNSTTANFTDIRIVDTDSGETLMGPIDADVLTTALAGSTAITEAAGDDADSFYLFTDEFDMAAGDELNLALTVDVENNSSLNSDTIIGALELGSSYPEIRDANNKVLTNTASLVPASPITGKTMTITTPSLTLSLAANPSGEVGRVKGEKNVPFVGISARCSTASDCTLVDVELTGYIDDSGADDGWVATGTGSDNSVTLKSIVGSVWLEDADGNVVATSESVQSDGTVDFTSIDYPIEGGETITIYPVGDIASDAYKNSNAEDVAFGIATAGDVTFEDDDGNVRNASGTPNSEATGATDPSTWVNVSNGGGLTVTVDSATPNEDIVVGNSVDQVISKFKFTSTDEAFTINKVSLQNRQSGVATANLGDYDDNVQNVKVWYTDEDGVAQSKSGTLTSGNVQFEGLTLWVPKDDDAVLTVTATVTEVEGGAGTEKGDAGDFIDLVVAFNNFEATAMASGATYKGDKLDSDVSADSDLDVGTITFVSTGVAVGTANATLTAGTSEVVTTADLNVTLPVGALVKFGAASATYTEATEPMIVLTTKYTDGDLTMTGLVLNDHAATDIEAGDTVAYALPGTGYLANTKHQHTYRTLPTLALSASSPTGSATVSPTDTIFKFSVTPDANDDVIVRQGLEGDDENDVVEPDASLVDADVTITTTSGDFIDGSGGVSIIEDDADYVANDCIYLDEAHTDALDDYGYVSFWIKVDEAADANFDLDSFDVITDDDNADCTDDGNEVETNLGSTTASWINGANPAAGDDLTDNTWAFATVAISAASDDDYFGLLVNNSNDLDSTDEVFIDGVVFHNEMLVVDLAGNAVLDPTPDTVIDCTLKDGTTVVAAGTAGVSTTSQARVLMVPQDHLSGTDYQALEMPAGTGKTYSLVCDTQDLIDQTANDDLLTPSIDYGSSTDGDVTEGDFWWTADEATKTIVRWLGDVGTKLSGNTLKY